MCQKRGKRNIAKSCMHKIAGSGINEMIFPSFNWTYLCLLVINQGLTNILSSVWQLCQFILVYIKKFLKPKHSCMPFSPLHIALCQLIAHGFPCFFYNTPQYLIFLGNLFTIEIEKSPMLLYIRLCVTVISLKGGF